MIIRTLRLENFGVYLGVHEFDLSPSSPDRPIVLFGGLNGGGKTTLLDAIQLALFGKLSRCSTRGTLSYDEFLKRSISRGAGPDGSASITLAMTQTFDGESHDFVITRKWSSTPKSTSESFVVQRDNVFDADLAENWLEHVDQFVPVGLAELFFFDGEQIARLAESDNAAQMLSTAISTLLGIDLVDRLERDLTVYEREVAKSRPSDGTASLIADLEKKIDDLKKEQTALAYEKAQQLGNVDSAQRRVETTENSFRRQGGDLFNKRKQLLAELDSTKHSLARVEAELREIAAGACPLALLQPQILNVKRQASKEAHVETQRIIVEELENRDRSIISTLKRGAIPETTIRKLESAFDADRKERQRECAEKSFLNLDKDAVQALHLTTNSLFQQIETRSRKLIADHRLFVTQSRRIVDTLAQVPDEKAIAQASDQMAEAQRDLIKRQTEWSITNRRYEEISSQVADEENKLVALLHKNASTAAEHEDFARKLRFAGRVRETMRQFRMRVLDRKIRQIEDLILESFQQLARKTDLISQIKIDPSTYHMRLCAPDGAEIHADRLSAGERQLLAVSTLWGLARASGRPLPTIIDTPLGRLDSVHRSKLVNSYFPYASHQVIILSTDEEIGHEHLRTLRPRITRSFELTYSPETKSTSARSGYFFN